jgi:hypothetical protein
MKMAVQKAGKYVIDYFEPRQGFEKAVAEAINRIERKLGMETTLFNITNNREDNH